MEPASATKALLTAESDVVDDDAFETLPILIDWFGVHPRADSPAAGTARCFGV